MMVDLGSLNANQRQAVEWDDGHLLVLAGPGSGKTRVLTLRVAKLIADSPEGRFRVLGLTFTTKAASEMRGRVDELIGADRERALLTTFHSFCADLLRQHGSHVGVRPDFAILTQDADREEILGDAVSELQKQGRDVPDTGTKLLPVIDRIFADCIDETEVAGQFRDSETGALAQVVFAEYSRQLARNGRLDFPSLLYLCERLLRARPQVARHVQTVYPFICVDEFQDTNLAQYRVLEEISGHGKSTLFVVADDDQIIYQWNGASPERLESLRTDYNMNVVQLPESYRCPGRVLRLANNLIAHNTGRPKDKLPLSPVKVGATADCIRCHRFSSFDAELKWIAGDLHKRPQEERPECVVLGRTARLLNEVVSTLNSEGVLAHLHVRKAEFDSAPMRWVHAALRLANARQDREQLRRLCKAFHALQCIDIRVDDVVADASLEGNDYLRTWCQAALRYETLEPETSRFLESMVESLVDRMDHASFTANAFDWAEGMEDAEPSMWDSVLADYVEERELWQHLVQDTRAKYGGGEVSLNALLQEIDLAPKTPPPPPGAVQCMTVHGAKGLEFRHVYLCGLAEDMLPSYQSRKCGDDSREMQEERRNCFVAITRAIDSLALTFSSTYFGWNKEPSRFLSEMGFDVAQKNNA